MILSPDAFKGNSSPRTSTPSQAERPEAPRNPQYLGVGERDVRRRGLAALALLEVLPPRLQPEEVVVDPLLARSDRGRELRPASGSG